MPRAAIAAIATGLLAGCVSAPVLEVANCDFKKVTIMPSGYVKTYDCGPRGSYVVDTIPAGTEVYRLYEQVDAYRIVHDSRLVLDHRYATSPLEHPDAPDNREHFYISP